MSGIAHLSVTKLRTRIREFNSEYKTDWDHWIKTLPVARAVEMRRILGKWQACRGNTLRKAAASTRSVHPAPYISDLLVQAQPHIKVLKSFDLRLPQTHTAAARRAIRELWNIFEQLSYDSMKPDRIKAAPRKGLAGIVGISKATLLVTDGRVGPAFDSVVRGQMGIRRIDDASQWLDAIQVASDDIVTFEERNGCTLHSAANLRTPLHTGRIYDMALGP